MRRWWAFALWNSLLWAQGEAFRAPVPPFEGVIIYKVKVRGDKAELLKENEPPTEMHLYIHRNRFLVNETGGAFPISRLYEPDSDWVYIIDPPNKRVFKYEKYRRKARNYPATYAGDSLQILGEWCYAFYVKKPEEEITYYVSPKYRVDLGLFAGKKRAQAFFLNEGLYGAIPLKMIRKQEGMVIEVTAAKVKHLRLDPESLKIPKGYEILGYDYRR
ncbi:MAG: hypothetical protein NZZ60_01260 [Bacteroidia bacterium]|nr:hypothetical protein [Bacteroidia bacterium]MCX7652724.1 hypothetical protein [Bacteroidia bacterium]MDW8416392.1 hypothetical protein [Bacteroidia bacterium]